MSRQDQHHPRTSPPKRPFRTHRPSSAHGPGTPRYAVVETAFPLASRSWVSAKRPSSASDGDEQERALAITVVTYNILADNLAYQHRHLYDHTFDNHWLLQWSYRAPRLLFELRESQGDVICLQEVQEKYFYSKFQPYLAQHGYQGLYKRRLGNKQDGLALFFRKSKLRMVDREYVEYSRFTGTDRDNVGIVVLFEGLDSGQRFCVATTHILFNTKRGDIKLAQLSCLLARIDAMATKHSRDATKDIGVVVCGDMNMTPHSSLYQFMISGSLDTSDSSLFPYWSGQTPMPLWLSRRRQLTGTSSARSGAREPQLDPRMQAVVDEYKQDNVCAEGDTEFELRPWQLPWARSRPSIAGHVLQDQRHARHPFRLQCAYHPHVDAVSGEEYCTTWHGDARQSVDFMFFGTYRPELVESKPESGPATSPVGHKRKQSAPAGEQQGHVCGNEHQPGRIELQRFLQPPIGEACQPMPNESQPSDHCLLAARFCVR
ncbi:Endonuclease/exonuclease/phosphatase [Polychytrium aggregatum]|uniref:Endonuclease/exonuclease/phosphatase n=1 Tax=Polychytrium aggregatum TaxID=110093 RepID=UPI0022FDCE21|nr:Endonuclease/exonuclease/phosphatase [Polychytrium aggregatum]KAI9209650.1 Endonuclease/exonuclease/phosphatase [Polychytrium aggregatum]